MGRTRLRIFMAVGFLSLRPCAAVPDRIDASIVKKFPQKE